MSRHLLRPAVRNWIHGAPRPLTAAYAGPFDGITFAALYGMKRFLTAYTGPLIRIRRSSDNAETDIGYVEATGLLDTAAAAAHIGGGSGFVVTWYDQSGNTRNATQATAAAQPLYVASLVNSLPGMHFDGTDDIFTLPNYLTGFTAGSHVTAIKLDADPPSPDSATGLYRYGSSTLANHFPYSDGNIYDDFGSTLRKSAGNPTPSLASWRAYSVSSAASLWTSRIDGTTNYTTGTNTVAWDTTVRLGGNGIYFLDGDMTFHCVLSVALEANHATYNTIGNEIDDTYLSGSAWNTVS